MLITDTDYIIDFYYIKHRKKYYVIASYYINLSCYILLFL